MRKDANKQCKQNKRHKLANQESDNESLGGGLR